MKTKDPLGVRCLQDGIALRPLVTELYLIHTRVEAWTLAIMSALRYWKLRINSMTLLLFTRRWKAKLGVFNVAKKNGAQHLVSDCRLANELCRPPPVSDADHAFRTMWSPLVSKLP